MIFDHIAPHTAGHGRLAGDEYFHRLRFSGLILDELSEAVGLASS